MSAGAFSSVTSSSVIWIVRPRAAISARNRRSTTGEKGGPPTAVRCAWMPTASTGVPDCCIRSQQIQQHSAAHFVFGRVELDIVFVDDEPGIRIGVARRVIGEVEIFGSERFEKYRRAQPVRPPVLRFDRLVDDIPAVDNTAIASGKRADPVDDGALAAPLGWAR